MTFADDSLKFHPKTAGYFIFIFIFNLTLVKIKFQLDKLLYKFAIKRTYTF